jgi:signal transduction histidine kinase/ligand-binding sensor domain-containing protein
MKGIIQICFLIFLQISFHTGIAQNTGIRFNLVEGINGKPLGKITAITQDPHGYMWFAGQDAQCLYRYDGSRWVIYKRDNLNPNTLGGNSPETVFADDKGLVWIGYGGDGVDQLNPATGIFKHYRHLQNDGGSLCSNTVSVVFGDRQGRLWVGTDNGLDRLDEKTGKFIHYRHEPGNPRSLSSNSVRAIYEDHKGVIWVGTGWPWFRIDPDDGGLNRLEPDGGFTRYLHDPKNPHSLINNKVRSIFEDSRGVFWVGTSGDGLHTMNRETGFFERHEYDSTKPEQLSRPPRKSDDWHNYNDQVTSIIEDCAGAVWIGSMWSGINRYDTGTKKITHYDSSYGFPGRSVWNTFRSKDDVLWLTTQEDKLYRVEIVPKTIRSIDLDCPVSSILEDKNGFIWVGTEGKGLMQFDQNKKLIHQFKNDASNPFSLFKDSVHCLLQDSGDSIWLGAEGGPEIFNMRTKQFSRFSLGFKYSDPQINGVLSIYQDKQGFKWFSAEGIVRYNQKDGSIRRYMSDAKDSGTLSTNQTTCFLEDRSGGFWVGTIHGGINRLNRQTDRFRHYLPDFIIISLYEDSQGILWVGTNKGLYRYNKTEDRFSPFFDSQSEIGTEECHSIVEDDAGNLWICTISGIIKLNPARDESFIYGSRFGIDQGTWYGALCKTGKGELLVGHENGFYAFSMEGLAVKKDLKIMMTDLYVNNQPVLPGEGSPLQKPVEEINDVRLKYNQNNIAFHYTAVDYHSPEGIKYFSMLEGYDNVWREAIGEKRSYYFNVPPGDYVYRVKAYNIDGVKGEKAIDIRIDPPWWRTWWAYTLYGLLLLTGVFAFVRFQKQRIVRNERQKTQTRELAQAKEIEKAYTELKATQAQLIQSEKMASLGVLTAGIAHEIQNPLNFVNNFSEINAELMEELKTEINSGNTEEAIALANNVQQNDQKIMYHGKRADGIVKGMLQHSRSSTGQKEPTDINELADEYLRLAYHGLRAKDKSFNVTLKTDFDQEIEKINIIPQDIGRVLLNLYNNAFYAVTEKKEKQGEDFEPTVEVSTIKSGKQIEIKVKDNGNGIPKKELDKIFQPFFTTKPTGQGTGLGLSLSFDIVKAHGGEIKVDTLMGQYTTFIIILPA